MSPVLQQQGQEQDCISHRPAFTTFLTGQYRHLWYQTLRAGAQQAGRQQLSLDILPIPTAGLSAAPLHTGRRRAVEVLAGTWREAGLCTRKAQGQLDHLQAEVPRAVLVQAALQAGALSAGPCLLLQGLLPLQDTTLIRL